MAYPRDSLPKKLNIVAGFIIDFHDSNSPGLHWVAVKIGHNEAYYIDSFGSVPLEKVTDILSAK